MNEILSFLKANSVFLIEIALSICVILITLLKKKVKINTIFEMVLTVLPAYIREAENKYKVGTEKYSYVFNRCIDYLVLLTGQSKEKNIQEYASRIDIAIENILSTPAKKK